MKVNFAAQVFSGSFADALEFCNKELHLSQFQGCEATVDFFRTKDSAFDVLNSSNPVAKHFKAPLRSCNKIQLLNVLQKAEFFLLNLRDSSGKLLHKG